MAHPFQAHKDHKVRHERVAHITKGYASGGGVHSDVAEDRRLVKKMVKPAALKVDGEHGRHRSDRVNRARGGKVKGKSAKTNVNVIIGQPQGAPPVPVPVPAGGPPPVPPPAAAGPPPRPPMMPPPGVGVPGAMAPAGIGPRAHGGRAYAKGGAVKPGPAFKEGVRSGTQVQHSPNKNDLKDIGRGKPVTYAKGGRVRRAEGGKTNSQKGPFDDPRLIDISKAITGHPYGVPTLPKPKDKKTGGRVEAPAKPAKAKPVHLPGGSGGGLARQAKAARAAKVYAKAK